MINCIASKKVKIRKKHQCWGCVNIFSPGTEMIVTTNTDNGEIFDCYWCDKCQAFINSLDSQEVSDGFMIGELSQMNNYPKPEVNNEPR